MSFVYSFIYLFILFSTCVLTSSRRRTLSIQSELPPLAQTDWTLLTSSLSTVSTDDDSSSTPSSSTSSSTHQSRIHSAGAAILQGGCLLHPGGPGGHACGHQTSKMIRGWGVWRAIVDNLKHKIDVYTRSLALLWCFFFLDVLLDFCGVYTSASVKYCSLWSKGVITPLYLQNE